MKGGGWRVEGGGWRVKGRVEGVGLDIPEPYFLNTMP